MMVYDVYDMEISQATQTTINALPMMAMTTKKPMYEAVSSCTKEFCLGSMAPVAQVRLLVLLSSDARNA